MYKPNCSLPGNEADALPVELKVVPMGRSGSTVAPPTFLLRRNRGFGNQPSAVSSEARCPLPPRRHRSMVHLAKQESVRGIAVAQHPSSCRAAMKRSPRIYRRFFGGVGYRRINLGLPLWKLQSAADEQIVFCSIEVETLTTTTRADMGITLNTPRPGDGANAFPILP